MLYGTYNYSIQGRYNPLKHRFDYADMAAQQHNELFSPRRTPCDHTNGSGAGS